MAVFGRRMATRLHIQMAFYAKRVCVHNSQIDRQRAKAQQYQQLPSYANGFFQLRPDAQEQLDSGQAHASVTAEGVQEGSDRGRVDWGFLEAPYAHEAGKSMDDHQLWVRPAVAAVDPTFLPQQPDPDTDWCPLPILHHEPWNTMESWHMCAALPKPPQRPERDR